MLINKKIISFYVILFLFGCHPVSHIIVGDIKAPISPSEVKLYIEFPIEYETIAIVEASSEFAFKDPSIDITWQDKTDKIIERLKIEAAGLGANGIVIKKTGISQNYILHLCLAKEVICMTRLQLIIKLMITNI